MITSELMDGRITRFLAAARHFVELLPALPIPADDRVDIASQGTLLMSALNVIAGEPAVRGNNDPERGFGALFDRGIVLLERNLRSFQMELLLADDKPFDEEEFGRKVAGASEEELRKLLSTLDDCDEDPGLDGIEKAIGGLGGLKAPGRVARIKALILILIELLLRLKGIPAPEQIRRIIRALLKQIDKLADGAAPSPQMPSPQSQPGPQTPSTPGGGSSSGSGSSSNPTPSGLNVEEACLIDVYLRDITAEDLDNTGNEWEIQLQVGQGSAGTIIPADPSNSFDRTVSPARFRFRSRERNRRTVLTEKGCGSGSFNINITATQFSGVNDSANAISTVDYTCGQRLTRTVQLRVYDNSNTSNKSTLLTFVFDIVTVCTIRPQGDD